MRYRLPEQSNQLAMASLSSMIDIIFLLIIFFVVTASFDREQIDTAVSLPLVGSNAIKSLPPERVMINILADGSVKTGFLALSATEVADRLPGILKHEGGNTQSVIIINADKDMPHKHLAAVMNAIAKAGYSQVRINAEIRKAGN